MAVAFVRNLSHWTASILVAMVVASQSLAAEQYVAFPKAGIEVLQPEGFQWMADPEGYQDPETGANVIVDVSDNAIEVEIAGISHGTLEQNGIEIVEKQPITVAGMKGILVSTRQKSDAEAGTILAQMGIAQWIVAFGDRTTVLVVASYPVAMADRYSEMFKQVVLSARPLKRGAAAAPQRETFGRNALDRNHAAGAGDADKPQQLDRGRADRDRLRVEMSREGRRRFGRSDDGDDEQATPLKPLTRSIARLLPRPKQGLASFEYRKQDVETSEPVGDGEQGQAFDEFASKSGVLVGLNVIRGEEFSGNVAGVEPIFQVGGRYRSSGVFGSVDGESQKLIAPPGYAVGGVEIRKGLVMDAIRLVYMPIDGTELDTENVEHSEWVGGDGGSPQELIGDGSLVVGIGGTADENGLQSVRLHFVVPEKVEIEQSRSTAATKSPAVALRKWTSANGKFSIEARLKSIAGENVLLIDKSGKTVRVPLEKLSAADREFVDAQSQSSPFEVTTQEKE